jgi:hypothetical protein
MELLDRYLYAIGKRLPARERDDIVAELADSIRSEMEEREAELGRPLTADEQSAVIKAHGHPIVAAGRYQTQRYLIGPALFPYYVNALRIALPIAIAIGAAVALVLAAGPGGPVSQLAAFWGTVWYVVFGVFSVATAVFALLERFSTTSEIFGKWDPRALPRPSDSRRIPRAQTAAELAFNVAAILFVLNVPGARHVLGYMIVGPGVAYLTGTPFAFAPAMQVLFGALLVGWVAILLQDLILLARPEWTRLRAGTLTAQSSVLLLAVLWVLPAHTFVVATGGASQLAQYGAAAQTLNQVAFPSLVVLAALCVLTIVLNVRALWRHDGGGNHAPTGSIPTRA